MIPTCNERVIKDTSSPDLRKVCDEAFPEGREGDEILNTCPSEQFQCEPGECIYSQFVCDGEPDCSNGLDETNCLKYTSLYMVRHDFYQLINQNISTNFDNRNSEKKFQQIKVNPYDFCQLPTIKHSLKLFGIAQYTRSSHNAIFGTGKNSQ